LFDRKRPAPKLGSVVRRPPVGARRSSYSWIAGSHSSII